MEAAAERSSKLERLVALLAVAGDRIRSRATILKEQASQRRREAERWPEDTEERLQGEWRARCAVALAEKYRFFAEWHVAMVGLLWEMAAGQGEDQEGWLLLPAAFKPRYSDGEIAAIVRERARRKMSGIGDGQPDGLLDGWPAGLRTEVALWVRRWRLHHEWRDVREDNAVRLRAANASMCECERRQMRFLDIAARFVAARDRSEAALAASRRTLASDGAAVQCQVLLGLEGDRPGESCSSFLCPAGKTMQSFMSRPGDPASVGPRRTAP